MFMSQEEIIDLVTRLQPVILAEDKRDGASLTYKDESGRIVTEKPDGSIAYEMPACRQDTGSCPN
ncbi:MAG: hypothetical protein J5855_01275 [Mailhella sp.]|nr:hypothetical protein [Mailhella sp.]